MTTQHHASRRTPQGSLEALLASSATGEGEIVVVFLDRLSEAIAEARVGYTVSAVAEIAELRLDLAGLPSA